MPYARLTVIKAAMKRASAWGVAEACGFADGLRLRSFDVAKGFPPVIRGQVSEAFPIHSDPGALSVGGGISAYMRYEGLELPMALCLGQSAGPPAPAGEISFSQRLAPIGSINGLFATLALHTGVDVLECPSLKLTGFVLRGEVGGHLEVFLQCMGNDMRADSVVNTPASLGTVLLPRGGRRVFFSDGVFRMNEAAGAKLEEVDVIRPSSFEFGFMRSLKGMPGVGEVSEKIDEPGNIEEPVSWLDMVMPRYRGGSDMDALASGVRIKSDISFTGPRIEEGVSSRFTLRLPSLARASSGLGRKGDAMTRRLSFRCLAPQSPPAGMPAIAAPFDMEFVNTTGDDILA